jgi:hypothetical protein
VALRRVPRGGIEELIRVHLTAGEDEATKRLCRRLRAARRRGYLTRAELEAVCRWKSPRAIWHVRANPSARVRAATRAALRARSEGRRVAALLELDGVSIAMASAILTLLDPRRYGVIDIRVWQLLHAAGAVRGNREGASLRESHWHEFLGLIRHFAAKLRVTARDVERALFDAHRAYQRGTLYRTRPAGARAAR